MKIPFKTFVVEVDNDGLIILTNTDVMSVCLLDSWSQEARHLLKSEFSFRKETDKQVTFPKKKRHFCVVPGTFFGGCSDFESVAAVAKRELDCSFALVEDTYFLGRTDPAILGFARVVVFHRLSLADFEKDLWQLFTVQSQTKKDKENVLSVDVINEDDFIKDLPNQHILFLH